MPATAQLRGTPKPSVKDIRNARQAFIAGEPRYLFYRVATELINLSRNKETTVSVAEALAVLLQTWNMSFYRFRGRFNDEDLKKLGALLAENAATIDVYRERSIASLVPTDEQKIKTLFTCFEDLLGPVGAAKCLHLLAPAFFPLWDRAIAKAYHLKLDGGAANEYLKFMFIANEQSRNLIEQGAPWPDLLKALDEYNYCRFTLNETRGIQN